MKAKKKIDYITTNDDLTKIKIDEVSSSSVFNKERTLSQNKNNNINNTKVSPYIILQSNNTTTKPKTVKDNEVQRTSNDENYSNVVHTNQSPRSKHKHIN